MPDWHPAVKGNGWKMGIERRGQKREDRGPRAMRYPRSSIPTCLPRLRVRLSLQRFDQAIELLFDFIDPAFQIALVAALGRRSGVAGSGRSRGLRGLPAARLCPPPPVLLLLRRTTL